MGSRVVLKGNGADLELDAAVNDLGWTRCYLVTDNKILLGADGVEYVIAGLLRALQDTRSDDIQPDGEINGTRVRYATHLEEAHHSLYYGDVGDERLLFWQSDARHPITLAGIIRLSSERRRQWQQQLDTLLYDQLPLIKGHRSFNIRTADPVVSDALK